MENLELKHLAPYLPYGLKGKFNVQDVDLNAPWEFRTKELRTDSVDFFLKYCKPTLRPLSDLTKEIEVNGEKFVPDLRIGTDKWCNTMFFEDDFLKGITRRETSYNIKQCSFNVIQNLFEWHFDVFELIPAGLAIDINTLK